jgi:hypothetical protein
MSRELQKMSLINTMDMNKASKQIQSENMNLQNGLIYYEQYFTTVTYERLSTEDYERLSDFIQTAVDKLTDGQKIVLDYEQSQQR